MARINTRRKGARNERRAKIILEDDGYYVCKASASLGAWDLVCFNHHHLRLVQVKTNRCRLSEKKALIRFQAPEFAVKELWIFKDRVAAPLIEVLDYDPDIV